jgi:ribonuclease P protein component
VSGAAGTPPGSSFPRVHRIRRRADFLRVQACTRPVRTRHLLLLYAAFDGPTRIGIVASRKVGPAVVRNRMKRLVREAFRRIRSELPAGMELVVVVRPPEKPLDLDAILRELQGAAPELARRFVRAPRT